MKMQIHPSQHNNTSGLIKGIWNELYLEWIVSTSNSFIMEQN